MNVSDKAMIKCDKIVSVMKSEHLSPFKYSNTNKRYHTLTYYYEHTYGGKVAKLALDAGFSCPHIFNHHQGGCTFCSVRGSGDFTFSMIDLHTQMKAQKAIMQNKWPKAKTIAYFQAYTNTYAPLETLKKIYDPFFDDTYDHVEVAIGTRSDCLDDDIIAYFVEKSKYKPITIELGVQSIHPSTSRLINRQHSLESVEEVLQKLKETNIKVVLHMINGLPKETPEMMVESFKWVAKQPIHGVKIHMLHILEGTVMGIAYKHNPWPILTMDEYVSIIVDQLEVLPPTMIIHRLTGDALASDLIEPKWTIKKVNVLNHIDVEFVRRNSMQGSKYETQEH